MSRRSERRRAYLLACRLHADESPARFLLPYENEDTWRGAWAGEAIRFGIHREEMARRNELMDVES